MEIVIHILEPEDLPEFIELIRLFEEVFELKNMQLPPEDHLQGLLENEDFMVMVASHEERIIGGLTAYTLRQYISTQPLLYIYDLAVLEEHQRKGVGNQLIRAVNAYGRENGFEEVFVQADKEEPHAVNFYRSTDPTEEEDVAHFYYKLNG